MREARNERAWNVAVKGRMNLSPSPSIRIVAVLGLELGQRRFERRRQQVGTGLTRSGFLIVAPDRRAFAVGKHFQQEQGAYARRIGAFQFIPVQRFAESPKLSIEYERLCRIGFHGTVPRRKAGKHAPAHFARRLGMGQMRQDLHRESRAIVHL